MRNNYHLLISINFISTSGGIARVARLISESMAFNEVLSYYGNETEKGVKYFNKNTFLFLLYLLKTIILNRPSVIVFDHIGPASLLKFVPSFLLKGTKVVIFLHDEEAWAKVSPRHFWGLEKSTHLLCNSHYTYNKFIHYNPTFESRSKVCLLAGVPKTFLDVPIFDEDKFKIFKGKKFCLFVSRLWKQHRYKGHFELIDSFELCISEERNFPLTLIIIGRGNDVENLKNAIYEKGLQEKIFLLTDINDAELTWFYKNCTAFIFPSTREGFGFVFLEAMYFSKACIGIVNQPAEEIIISNETGLLVENNSPEKLKEVLLDIVNNENKFFEFGKNAKELYNRKFRNVDFKERFLNSIQ